MAALSPVSRIRFFVPEHDPALHHLQLFARGLAHELNNNLSGLLGLIEKIVSNPRVAALARDDVALISKEGERARALSRRLSDFGRVQPGGADSSVELRSLVEEIGAARRAMGREAAPNVELGGDPVWVAGVSADLSRAISLLLDRAMMSAGASAPITLALFARLSEDDAVRLPAEMRGRGWAVVAVSGGGPPLREATLSAAVGSLPADLPHAAGLALAAASGLLMRNGAYLGVDESYGDGSSLLCFLPHGSAPQTVAATAGNAGWALVLDGEAVVRRIVSWQAEALGFEVEAVSTITEAREAKKRHGGAPSLAIVDASALESGADELLRLGGEELPLVLLSDSASEPARPALDRLRRSVVLAKPASVEDLARAIESARSAA